ncbi:FkbM family methyltransferase [Sphingopyxis sp. 2PD]|uniref:FkbM family methyltransferase n=1 Tax=Sphingopyxis sp. 2PD TaxID=2502196 RepID=UPI001485AEAB|nr:FkbM family methyltransferase [Sphingopyxis sp. 2PD]
MISLKTIARRNRYLFLLARRLKQRIKGLPEPELDLLTWLVDRDRTAIDIGAHSGLYSQMLSRFSKHVIAIEAIPELAANLRRLFPQVEVINAAASDRTGVVELAIPEGKPGLSSVAHEQFEPTLAVRKIEVECLTVDGLMAARTDRIGFIKIDVEGHELAVLEGARATIARHRPTMLIEAEERHRPGTIAAIFDFFDALDYSGFYLDGQLRALKSFDPAVHQSTQGVEVAKLDRGGYAGKYINNFIFIA